MGRIRVEGGHPLRGTLSPSGNKNAALPILAAALLCQGNSTISNIPATTDVQNVLRAVANCGGIIQSSGETATVNCPAELCPLIGPPLPASPQASLLLAAPLLHQAGEAVFTPLVLAKERLATHTRLLAEFGIEFKVDGETTRLQAPDHISGREIWLPEASVTATELAILFAVRAVGDTELHNAASEPHVQDLIQYLSACGAQIEGSGSNLLRIRGVSRLTGTNHRLAADPIEIGSFIVMAAITRGAIDIEDVRPDFIQPILHAFEKFNIQVEPAYPKLHIPTHDRLWIERLYEPEQASLASAPWPGFPSDLMPLMAVAASQAEGSLLLHEKMYNTRMYFLDSLLSMGARLVQCDPHRALVFGPDRLISTYLETPDVRTGLALLGASLVANGVCLIDDVEVINRIFPDVIDKLTRLGAVIQIL